MEDQPETTDINDIWFNRFDQARVICKLLDDQMRVHSNLKYKSCHDDERIKLENENNEMWNVRMKWFVLRDLATTAMKIRDNPQKYHIVDIDDELNRRSQKWIALFNTTTKETNDVLKKYNIKYDVSLGLPSKI